MFWLIEELLDSQTIEGCKRVFDYLESRRERITAVTVPLLSLCLLNPSQADAEWYFRNTSNKNT